MSEYFAPPIKVNFSALQWRIWEESHTAKSLNRSEFKHLLNEYILEYLLTQLREYVKPRHTRTEYLWLANYMSDGKIYREYYEDAFRTLEANGFGQLSRELQKTINGELLCLKPTLSLVH